MSETAAPVIRDNPDASRYEAELDGHVAVVDYNLIEGGIIIAHTGVPKSIEGRGAAGALFRAVLDRARAEGWRVVPVCPVFALWLKRHPEAHDLIDPGFRRSLGLTPQ